MSQGSGKLYVAKYSSRADNLNHVDYHGKWCAIDDASGGYPYATEWFGSAKVWYSLESALDYQRMFPYLDVYEFEVSLKLV